MPQILDDLGGMMKAILAGVIGHVLASIIHASSSPLQEGAPWPLFRHDRRNTGQSHLHVTFRNDKPWSFKTGKGIFSTPVIDRNGTIFVGSADHILYALSPQGTEKWRFETREIIDSAAALPAIDPARGYPTLVLPSGDGFLRLLNASDRPLSPEKRLLWAFNARQVPAAGYDHWWEGNVTIGPDGTYYAGNSNFNYYAINADGTLQWHRPTGSNNWSIAAIDDDGTLYWASNNTKVFAVTSDGKEKWSYGTWGSIAASAALGSDHTLYIGSFDSYLHAIDTRTGKRKWRFKTGDHIYGSPALLSDKNGKTLAVFVGSADGIFYALSPAGKLLWTYDTGDPIRSSPVLGHSTDDKEAYVVYFGSGNGKLYALNAANGSRRWSYNTTPDDPILRDRNDLNGSPALGHHGIYIGGEHGYLWYMPYDYCLHAADPRCQKEAAEDLPTNVVDLYPVTPGGSTQTDFPQELSSSTMITLRLVVRKSGKTLDGRLCSVPLYCRLFDDLKISFEPKLDFVYEKSADGHYLHIRPDDFLKPATLYRLTLTGTYYTDGLHFGNMTLFGKPAGKFSKTFSFRTENAQASSPTLSIGTRAVSAFEWTRNAAPLPTMIPSYNQIGIDYLDWIVGTLSMKPESSTSGKAVLLAIGGRHHGGAMIASPSEGFFLPFTARYKNDSYILSSRSFTLHVAGVPIPLRYFQLRGRFVSPAGMSRHTSLYAESPVLSIPSFAPYLIMAGLANNWIDKLVIAGTFITRPYAGPANRRPERLSVTSVRYQAPSFFKPGSVNVDFQSASPYRIADHSVGIVLVDPQSEEITYLDYPKLLKLEANKEGDLTSAALSIPKRTKLPDTVRVIVTTDVFPLHKQLVGERP